MNICLGTKSQIKVAGIKSVLDEYQNLIYQIKNYHLHTFDVESKVPDTPYDNQTYKGAKNRAQSLLKEKSEMGDLFIGIESGLIERNEQFFEECWCVILDKNNQLFSGYSSGLMLSRNIVTHLGNGLDHVTAMNLIAKDLKLSSKDTWSIYSNGILGRQISVQESFRNALLAKHSFCQDYI